MEGDSDIEYDPVPSKPGSAVHSEDGDGSEDSCSGLYSDSEEDDDEKSKLVNTSSQSQDCGIFDEWWNTRSETRRKWKTKINLPNGIFTGGVYNLNRIEKCI